jgi:hypothetical protein
MLRFEMNGMKLATAVLSAGPSPSFDRLTAIEASASYFRGASIASASAMPPHRRPHDTIKTRDRHSTLP